MLRHPDDDADPAKRGRSSYKILVIYIYIYVTHVLVWTIKYIISKLNHTQNYGS